MRNLNGVGLHELNPNDKVLKALEENETSIFLTWVEHSQLTSNTKIKLFLKSFDSNSNGIVFYLINRHKPQKSVPNQIRP